MEMWDSKPANFVKVMYATGQGLAPRHIRLLIIVFCVCLFCFFLLVDFVTSLKWPLTIPSPISNQWLPDKACKYIKTKSFVAKTGM